MKQRILMITTFAMFSAILLLMGLVPSLGFITLNPTVTFTIMHIPVLFGAYLLGWRGGLWFGFLFGMISFYLALSSPTTFLDPFFQNPLISVVPRVLFGLLSGLLFEAAHRWFPHVIIHKVALALLASLLTLMHTILVLSTLGLLRGADVMNILITFEVTDTFIGFILIVIALNGVWEAGLAFVLVPILAISVSKNSTFRRIINQRSPR
jgi:uncharacterized membrane protein